MNSPREIFTSESHEATFYCHAFRVDMTTHGTRQRVDLTYPNPLAPPQGVTAMGSALRRLTAQTRREAADACDDLIATLAAADVKLPSVAVDWQSAATTGVVLIDLGAARPDVVVQLIDVIREGVRARRARHPWVPAIGETVAMTPAEWQITTPGAPLVPAEVVEATGNLVTLSCCGVLRLRRLHEIAPWTGGGGDQ
jgi:hypothetical protein